MKQLLLLTALITFSFISCKKQKNAEAIRLTFESYKTAIKNQSDSALIYLDKESIDALIEFEKLIKSGSLADKDHFISKYDAPLTWEYLFWSIRSLGSQLYKLDEVDPSMTLTLFSLAGIPIFKSTDVDDFNFGEIMNQNEYISTVKIVVSNHFFEKETRRKVDIKKEFFFREEDGAWKFNVISYFNLHDKLIEYEASDKKMDPKTYIRYVTKTLK